MAALTPLATEDLTRLHRRAIESPHRVRALLEAAQSSGSLLSAGVDARNEARAARICAIEESMVHLEGQGFEGHRGQVERVAGVAEHGNRSGDDVVEIAAGGTSSEERENHGCLSVEYGNADQRENDEHDNDVDEGQGTSPSRAAGMVLI